MREKFDDLGTLVGGSLSKAENKFHTTDNYNITDLDLDNFRNIRSTLRNGVNNVRGIKITVGIDESFSVSRTSKFDKTLLMEVIK